MNFNGCVLYNDAVKVITEVSNLKDAFAIDKELGELLRAPFISGSGHFRVFVVPHRLRICETCKIVPDQPFVELIDGTLRCWCIQHVKTAVTSPIFQNMAAFQIHMPMPPRDPYQPTQTEWTEISLALETAWHKAVKGKWEGFGAAEGAARAVYPIIKRVLTKRVHEPGPNQMLAWLDEMVERTTGSAEEHGAKYLRETFVEAMAEGEFVDEVGDVAQPEATTRCPRCQYDHARPDDELMAMAVKYGVAERLALNCRKYREALRESLTYGCKGCRGNLPNLHWPDCWFVRLARLIGLPVKWQGDDDVIHSNEKDPA